MLSRRGLASEKETFIQDRKHNIYDKFFYTEIQYSLPKSKALLIFLDIVHVLYSMYYLLPNKNMNKVSVGNIEIPVFLYLLTYKKGNNFFLILYLFIFLREKSLLHRSLLQNKIFIYIHTRTYTYFIKPYRHHTPPCRFSSICYFLFRVANKNFLS